MSASAAPSPDGGNNPNPNTPPPLPNNFTGTSTGLPVGGSAPPAVPPAVPPANPPADPPADDEPEGEGDAALGHGGKPMSAAAISERVERARAKLLREVFGRDIKPEDAKALVAKVSDGVTLTKDEAATYARLKRQDEARARTRKTQEERQQAVLSEKDKELETLRTQIRERDQREAVAKQEQEIETAAGAAEVDPSRMKYAKFELAQHLKELQRDKPEAFKKFGKAQLTKFFADLVTREPIFKKVVSPDAPAPDAPPSTPPAGAKDKADPPPAAPPKAKPKEEPVVRKVTTTSNNGRPPAPAPTDPPGTYKGKTVKPGQPNSMNRAELIEYHKAIGKPLSY